MKKTILAVIAVGFLVVSCGGRGGNIKKVQNGVFSDYDNTITVGKALENNKFLKGGKWKAVEIDGRQYVTYAVKFTGKQVQEFLTETNSTVTDYKNKYNFWTAYQFSTNLSRWMRIASDAERLASVTSMSAEEINQIRDIFANVEDYAYKSGDIDKMLTIEGYEMILSFVMNQDGSFTTNMIEPTTEVTLNCFNNLKVQYSVGNIESTQSILGYIYTDKRPDFLGGGI